MNSVSSGLDILDNGLSPDRRQVNTRVLSIGPLETNFSELWIKIQNFSFIKFHVQLSSAKWWPFWSGGDELTVTMSSNDVMTHLHYEQLNMYKISPCPEVRTWRCLLVPLSVLFCLSRSQLVIYYSINIARTASYPLACFFVDNGTVHLDGIYTYTPQNGRYI